MSVYDCTRWLVLSSSESTHQCVCLCVYAQVARIIWPLAVCSRIPSRPGTILIPSAKGTKYQKDYALSFNVASLMGFLLPTAQLKEPRPLFLTSSASGLPPQTPIFLCFLPHNCPQHPEFSMPTLPCLLTSGGRGPGKGERERNTAVCRSCSWC